MEYQSIYVALITGACAVIGQWLIARENKRKADTERAVKDATLDVKLEAIEKRLDEHNNYAKLYAESNERLIRIEQEIKDMRGLK